MRRLNGFTITELMITVAIVGILVGVAVPSYQEYVRKSKRVDAKITLENLAAAQETHFFQNNKYATKFSQIRTVAESVLSLPSEEGYYAITLAGDNFAWSMSASAVGQQALDRECAVFTISHLGNHETFDSDGLPSSRCW